MKRKKTQKHEDSPKTLSNINNSSKSLQRKCRENESEDNQNKKKNPLNIYDLSQCLRQWQQLYGSSPETFFYIDLLKSFTRSQIIPFFSSNIC